MRNNLACVLAVAMCLTATNASAEDDANAFLRGYEQASRSDKARFEIAALNVYLGLGWANTYLGQTKTGTPIYCQPTQETMTATQVIEALRRLVEGRQSFLTMPYGMAILFAVVNKWPCPNSN